MTRRCSRRVLGLPLQDWISIQNRLPLTMKWDCLISLPHRVTRATILINLDVCLVFLPWLDSSCLHRLVNQLESWKLKLESKDILFIAFQQKKTRASQALHSPAKVGYLYPLTVKSCWVLEYSALLLKPFFSGMSFEDQIASLTYPCSLPPGWSVEWDTSSAGNDYDE